MSKLSKLYVAMICGTLFSALGCGSEEHGETRQTALVFGERAVRQSRNHLLNASIHAIGSENRQLDAILMMQSMPARITYLAAPQARG